MPAGQPPADGPEPADRDPLLRVVRGTPTTEELAALVGALLGRLRPRPAEPSSAVSGWSRSARPGAIAASTMPGRPEAGAWRRSGLPH